MRCPDLPQELGYRVSATNDCKPRTLSDTNMAQVRNQFPAVLIFPSASNGTPSDSGSKGRRSGSSQARHVLPHMASEIIGLGLASARAQFACVSPELPTFAP